MHEVRRFRPWILAALLLLLVALVFRLGASYAERKIAARIQAEATRFGVQIRFEDLHVGLVPPLQMRGVVIEKTGLWDARIDALSVSPRFWGSRGAGLAGRVTLDTARVNLPAELELVLKPSAWDVDPEHSIALRAPVEGLNLTVQTGPRGRALEIKASRLPTDRLGSFVFEGVPGRDLGVVDGDARVEGDPRRDFEGRWRFEALEGRTTGSIVTTPTQKDASLDITASFEGLDFTRLFQALGFDLPVPGEELGSLSGTVSARGRLSDVENLAVIQQFNFTPPSKRPDSVLELRGSFIHEVFTNEGVRKTIPVGPSSSGFIPLAEVPPLFIRALLIAEDAAFYSHPGIDLTEFPRAIATNLARGEAARGASTITQQLAKNLFLSREKSLHRKLQELSYSFLLESTLGKSRILEIYVNVIEWGPGLYGLRPAARHYFDKEPQSLTPKEIAFLVSLIPAPVKYQGSFQDGELRRGMERLVSNLLVKLRSVDAISEEEYQAALSETLVFRGHAPTSSDNPVSPQDQ